MSERERERAAGNNERIKDSREAAEDGGRARAREERGRRADSIIKRAPRASFSHARAKEREREGEREKG